MAGVEDVELIVGADHAAGIDAAILLLLGSVGEHDTDGIEVNEVGGFNQIP